MTQKPVYKYVIPVDDLSEGMKQTFRDRAINALLERALQCKVISTLQEALVKPPDPVADFGMAAGGWVTAAFAVVGTPVSIFNALTPTVANNRCVVFYGVWVDSLPFAANLLTFREGVAGGSTYAVFDLECLATRNQLAGYFSEPVWYDNNRVMNVTLTPRIVAGTQRIGLMGFTVEPRGPTVSA